MEKYKLKGFKDYQDFLNYSDRFFHLTSEDQKGLEDIIYKTQELEDWDAVKMMQEIAYIEHNHLPNFAKFLVFVESDPEIGKAILQILDNAENKGNENRLPQ